MSEDMISAKELREIAKKFKARPNMEMIEPFIYCPAGGHRFPKIDCDFCNRIMEDLKNDL